MKEEDEKNNMDLNVGKIKKFEEKKEEMAKKTLPTQVVEDWEINMWDDIAMDPSGNVMKYRKEQQDWEIIS